MTAVLMHHNESIFPNSWTFLPERWLGEEGKAKEKYMIAFSRGTRQCMGMKCVFFLYTVLLIDHMLIYDM
jgi:cytochrome P450